MSTTCAINRDHKSVLPTITTTVKSSTTWKRVKAPTHRMHINEDIDATLEKIKEITLDPKLVQQRMRVKMYLALYCRETLKFDDVDVNVKRPSNNKVVAAATIMGREGGINEEEDDDDDDCPILSQDLTTEGLLLSTDFPDYTLEDYIGFQPDDMSFVAPPPSASSLSSSLLTPPPSPTPKDFPFDL